MPKFKLLSKKPNKHKTNYYCYTFSSLDESNLSIVIIAENDKEAIELLNSEMDDISVSTNIQNVIKNFFNSESARLLINPFFSSTNNLYCSFQNTCEWFDVPVSAIDKFNQIGYATCNSLEYPLIEITFKDNSSVQKELINAKWWSRYNSDYKGRFFQGNSFKNFFNSDILSKELSGSQWVSRYPGSNSIDDLSSPFKENVNDFVNAVKNGGGSIKISATYRPTERAYLMQTSWDIAKGIISALDAPTLTGIDIEWVHPTDMESIQAAQDMVSGYGIVFRPAYPTKHSDRTAIDMNITWTGNIKIAKKDGSIIEINTSPKDNDNAQLQEVGETYSVLKLKTDKPHWSDDGH